MRHILTIIFLISLHASGQLRTLDQLIPIGGTTGQMLKKASATDWDHIWATPVKGDVGLGNVDNTSDANKPVSTATQTAIDGKQNSDADLTTIAGLTATTDNFLVGVSSAWASRTPAQVKTTLAINLVENTALSTWVGTSNITTVGTIGTGTWNATAIGVSKGGTGLTALGTGGQFLRTNLAGTLMEWTTLAGGGDMLAANNLSEVDPATARINLGVTTSESPTFTGTASIATANISGLITTATGTTSLAAINIPAGTIKTTVADGDIESDANAMYGATDAGNRGYIPIKHFIRCDAARTLPNDANTNAIFNSPTNGRITLETGTYLFESLILVTSMSATSGNAFINLLGAGTATVAAWMWRQSAIDAVAAGTLLDDDVQFVVTSTSVVTTGTTGTVFRIYMKGTFEVTVAGTFIPSIDLVTAAAASVNIGSYFTCERIGSTSLTNIGQWD